MQSYTATGITLAVRKFRGSGRVVTFYTAEQGKVEAVAAGIGKPGSSLAGAVEPFTVARLLLVAGRELDRLTQAQVLEAFPALPRRLEAYGYAAWMTELTARATEAGSPSPALFEALRDSLRALDQGGPPLLLAGGYALRLLAEQGLAPVLDHCAACEETLRDGGWYQAASGGLLCSQCRPAGEGRQVQPATRGLLHGLRRLPPERLGALHAPPAAQQEALNLLRAHIAYHLGLRLKSDAFLSELD